MKKRSLNIMYVSRILPFPPNRGERQRDFHFLKTLAASHRITLVTRLYNEEDCVRVADARDFCDRVIARYFPRPRSGLEIVTRLGRPFLRGEPFIVGTMSFPQLGKEMHATLSSRRYDVVQIEQTPLAYYLNFIPAEFSGVRVIDLHNLEYLRLCRLSKLNSLRWRGILLKIDAKLIKRYEPYVLSKFDRIFSVSMDECAVIRKWLPGKKVTYLPNGVDFEYSAVSRKPCIGAKCNSILFVGSMNYTANEDGVLWFIRDVFPQIQRNMPGIRLTIVGHSPTRKLMSFASERIIVTGSVEDVAPFYNKASVFVVPLRAGGGSRIKILEAMKYCVPVVSTSLGADGLEMNPGKDIEIADDAHMFAERVIHLLANPGKRKYLVTQAHKRIRRFYKWESIGRTLSDALIESVEGKLNKTKAACRKGVDSF